MAVKNITTQVTENIAKGMLEAEEFLDVLVEKLIERRLGNFFEPIVRDALATALELKPDDIGPELISEALADSITSAFYAKTWIAERTTQMMAELRKDYADQYDGLENDDVLGDLARAVIVHRDYKTALDDAGREGVITKKQPAV